MKKFITEEIRDLLNQVYKDEISFSEMVEIMNERVSEAEVSEYKDGDFVVNVCGFIIIFKNKVEDSIYDHAYLNESVGAVIFSNTPSIISIERHATEDEKRKMLDALAKKGKRWNEEEKCIEDIPVRKFKAGDKVALKSGCTTSKSNLTYLSSFDEYIGKELIVIDYTGNGNVKCNNGFLFAEDWLELYVEKQHRKFKAGDKVRIKDGISSRTHGNVSPGFMSGMNNLIGKTMTVDRYIPESSYIICNEYSWNFNEDWLEPYVEDTPKRKFQKGDKVKIKNGVSSKTYRHIAPTFLEEMDNLIGKIMTVKSYSDCDKYVDCEETVYSFLEEWLEPYVEALKKDDLAIFWDNRSKDYSLIRMYDRKGDGGYYDSCGIFWNNAIKFESKEQYEKVLRGEI